MARNIGRTASSIGMMEGAFFVSRTDLIQWVNKTLQVSLTKVEQCASGAIYCQIIDACHPGSVAMRKVNWMAKADHEYIPNYKVLQAAFDRLGIERHIPVEMLVRAKYQDNLEFLQWIKCFAEKEGSVRDDYDPVAAREGKPVPAWAKPVAGLATLASTGALEKENLRPKQAAAKAGYEADKKPVAKVRPAAKMPADRPAVDSQTSAGVEALKAKVESQQEGLLELKATLDGLERERDYYFRKLRNVEIMCSTLEANMDPSLTAEKIVADIQGILYAENDEEDDQTAAPEVSA